MSFCRTQWTTPPEAMSFCRDTRRCISFRSRLVSRSAQSAHKCTTSSSSWNVTGFTRRRTEAIPSRPLRLRFWRLIKRRHLGFALAAVGYPVDHAHRQHIIGGVGFSSRKKLFRDAPADSPVQEGIGAHAREQIEQDLGEAEADMLLGDHDVAGQRGLEPASEAVALDQRDRGDGQVVRAVVLVQNVNAGGAVLDQTGAVPGFDQAQEQIEIAAQVEHARHAGGRAPCIRSAWA